MPLEPEVLTKVGMPRPRKVSSSSERRLAHRGERRVAGIEIEVHVVGPIDVVVARVPLVQIDAAEVDAPHQRRDVLHDRKIDDACRAVIDGDGLDPLGARRRRALHEEEVAGGAVRIALHDHGAIAQVRQQPLGDVDVVLDQIALGDVGPERLVEIGELDALAVDFDEGVARLGDAAVWPSSSI